MSKSKQKSDGGKKDADLQDSKRDQRELKNEEFTIDLPDVKDIPGQEHVHALNPREFADTTISSADEEGDNLWSDEDISDNGSDVSKVEKKLLDDTANDMPTKDERQLRRAELDSTDGDGDPLNEKSSANSISGDDLDVSGSDEDDENEEIGEEDEENNPYSLGGDNQSDNEERSGA